MIKTMRFLAAVAAAGALAGCVSQPAQRGVVGSSTDLNKARNIECMTVIKQFEYLSGEVDKQLSICEKNLWPGEPACLNLVALKDIDNKNEISVRVISCFEEGNIGGLGADNLPNFVATMRERTQRFERLTARMNRQIETRRN